MTNNKHKEIRVCRSCNKEKELSLFIKDSGKETGYGYRCRECDVIKSSKYYLKNKGKVSERHKKYHKIRKIKAPEKMKARTTMSNAIRDGRLIRLPCVVCGNPKSEGHHEDYSKPLKVMWLCLKHHKERHIKLPFSHIREQKEEYKKV